MNSEFQISNAFIAATGMAVLFQIFYPVVLAIVARRQLKIGWRYFGYGALIFFLFQLVTRLPLVQVVQGAIAPQLATSQTLAIAWLAVLSLTAGLFEEIGRYVGYRWLMKRETKTWRKAVMYGLGHGGIESMLLVAVLSLIGLVSLVTLSATGLEAVPEEQRAAVQQQLQAVSALPAWSPLLGAWERLWTVPVHVAFSVLVLNVFQRRRIVWLGIAIVAHTLFNFVSIGTPLIIGLEGINALLLTEGFITIFGAIALWWIWHERPKEEAL
jgi:uncharacterized membrane protein YhfC